MNTPESEKTSFTITFRDGTSHSVYLAAKDINDGVWLNHKGEKLQQVNDLTTKVVFGESVKIQIKTSGAKDGTKVNVKIKAKIEKQDVKNFPEIIHTLKVKDNTATLDDCYINPKWYNEEIENYHYKSEKIDGYNYKAYQTGINPKKTITFSFDAKFEAKEWDTAKTFPKNTTETLKPITYRRNYEELMGLYKYEDLTKKPKHSKTKDAVDNFENHYLTKNNEIKIIVDEFVAEIIKKGYKDDHEEKNRITTIVTEKSKALWDAAVDKVQNGSLDDRPLYWARNKMQVSLKRHPLFKDDFDSETSLIAKGTKLEAIISIFEEKSRNYTGTDIDFSKAPEGMKKLLITGFDPFSLDPLHNGNLLQSNPAGVNALALHNTIIDNYFIQTFIAPVRYKDFDEFKNGNGIIEEFAAPLIPKVDLIMTVSQGGIFRFDIDRFPARNRGGQSDNMFWGNSKPSLNKTFFKQLTISGKEFYETTLPYKKIVPAANKASDIFWIYFNQTFKAKGKKYTNDAIEGTEKIENISDNTPQNNCIINSLEELQSLKSIEGSGSFYLSNEIYYRIAKLREKTKPELPTGHLHIPCIQLSNHVKSYYISQGTRNAHKLTTDINPLTKELIKNIKEIIKKCD